MTAQHERSLQSEILYRLNRYPVVAIPVPNGIWLPARSEAEKGIVKRLIARMKTDGMLTPGAPDLVLLGAKGASSDGGPWGRCKLYRRPVFLVHLESLLQVAPL